MDKQELFTGIENLLVLLTEHRKSGTLTFKSADDKYLLRSIYKDIYQQVTPDLNCVTCILSYLNNLQAYYEREHPKYLKTLNDSVLNPIVAFADPADLLAEKPQLSPAAAKKRKGKR